MHIEPEDVKSCTLHISEDEWQEFIDLYESFWDKVAGKFGYGSVDEAMKNNRLLTIHWKLHEISIDTGDPTTERLCHWRGMTPSRILTTDKGTNNKKQKERTNE